MKLFFTYYSTKHITGTAYNPIGQAVIERSNHTIKEILNKQKGGIRTPRNKLNNALLTLIFLNANEAVTTSADYRTTESEQPVYFKDVLTSE